MKSVLEMLLGFQPGELTAADEVSFHLLGIPASSWAILGVAVVLAGLIWLTLRSYSREGDAKPAVKFALAALRIAVIVLILLALLQPALTMNRYYRDYSTVAVLVDESLSMSLADRYDQPLQRAELAAAVGVSPAELTALTRGEILARLVRGDTGSAALAELAGTHPLEILAFSTDQPGRKTYVRPLASIHAVDTGRGGALTPPSEQAIRIGQIVAISAGAVLAVLMIWIVLRTVRRPRHRPEEPPPGAGAVSLTAALLMTVILAGAVVYSHRSATVRTQMLAAPPAPPEAPTDVAAELDRLAGAIQSRGFETDLVQAVRGAVEHLRGRRVEAVVVVSDGRNTDDAVTPSRLIGARQFCRQRGMGLYAVTVGDDSPPRNLRIASLAIPPTLRRDSVSPVNVTIEARNVHGQSATLRLLGRLRGQDDWLEQASLEVSLPAPSPEAAGEPVLIEEQLTIRAGDEGDWLYRVEIEPVDGEVLTDDNAAQARVTVTGETIRVLLVSGDAGWEFQYLRNLMLRDPKQFMVSTWQQNADPEFNQQSSSQGMQLTSLPRTLDALVDNFDVIVLYDPAFVEGDYDGTFVSLLQQFVGTHRGGLCYIASNKYTGRTLERTSAARSGPFGPMMDMLPVSLVDETIHISQRIMQEEGVSWPVQVTALGAEHPILALDADAQRNLDIWRALPGIYWSHPVLHLKPAAVALAVSSDPAENDRDGNPSPLIATHMYGAGPVAYVGFDGTWRWRFVRDAMYYRKFWSNMIDFLASYRAMKRQVLITSAGETVSVGERLSVSVEAYDELFQPVQTNQFDLRIVEVDTGQSRTVALEPTTGQDGLAKPGLYRGAVMFDEPGEYELTAPAGIDPDSVASRFVTVTLPREELLEPPADPLALATLAGEDRAIPAGRFGELPAMIPDGVRTPVEPITRPLWNLWLTVVLLVSMLFIEWMIRKKHNMA